MKFIERLEALIKQSGLPKKTLAEQAGISRSNLYNLLNGEVSEAKLSTLIKLSSVLQVHPLDLLRSYFQGSVVDNHLSENLPGLGSQFVADMSFPDYSLVYTNQSFEKIWRLQNTGVCVWRDLFLLCQDTPQRLNGLQLGLKPQQTRVAIPEILPGETVDLSIMFKAPQLPCTVRSEWKMVDSSGKVVMPNKMPIYCLVKVVGV